MLLTRLILKKTCQLIVESENDYIGALKGNQPGLLKEVKANFTPESTTQQLNKGHGRIEKRTVSICRTLEGIRAWPGLRTIIRVESERQIIKGELLIGSKQVHYYISSLTESVRQIAQRVRGYWGVENRVHYVRDVTQGEDASRIRTTPLVQIWALARNFALNSYRAYGFKNIAQASRKCAFGLDILKTLFRMK